MSPVETLYTNVGASFVPITAAVEVLSQFHFPGPLSFPEIEQNHPDIAQVTHSSRYDLAYRDTSNDNPRGNKVRCHGARENRHFQDESMSQGPTAKSRPPSTSPHEERYNRLPPLGSRALPPIRNGNDLGSQGDVIPDIAATQHVSTRQPPQSSSASDQRSSRPIGVQNLLNPTSNGTSADNQNRRRNGEHQDPPQGATSVTAATRAATPSLPTPAMNKRSPASVSLPSITPPSINTYPQNLGRSPSLYAPSPVTVNGPSGTMDAKQSPFVLPRDHNISGSTGGPGAFGLPDMNRVPSMPGDSYGSGLLSSRSPSGGRRNSQDSARYDRMQTLLGRTGSVGTGGHPPASQSDSPSTQYSSYSQMSRQTPPAQPNVPPGQPQSFFTNPFNAGGPASTMAQMAFDVPASSGGTGGSSYQMMTLDTENGPIQVPVDVQAASKVADEKRKRNATASHRFRQRRKEKERETSSNIARLEQQIREMEEEKDFYRGERDYFRNLASRIPGQSHLLPRPASPRQRRHASMGGTVAFGNNIQFQDPESGSRSSARNTKRRTSSYVPPSGPAPQADVPPSIPHYQQAPPNPGSARALLQEPLSVQSGSFNPSTKR